MRAPTRSSRAPSTCTSAGSARSSATWGTASPRSNRSAIASRPTDAMLGRLVHFLRRSIAGKLTLTLVGFVAVTTLLAGLYLNRALEAFAVEPLEAHVASPGRLLADPARAGLARGAAAR